MRSDDTPSEIHEAVAAEVRAELARQQMSQSELARRLGVNQPWISRRLIGTVPLDVRELAQIAEILRIPTTRFFPPPPERAA